MKSTLDSLTCQLPMTGAVSDWAMDLRIPSYLVAWLDALTLGLRTDGAGPLLSPRAQPTRGRASPLAEEETPADASPHPPARYPDTELAPHAAPKSGDSQPGKPRQRSRQKRTTTHGQMELGRSHTQAQNKRNCSEPLQCHAMHKEEATQNQEATAAAEADRAMFSSSYGKKARECAGEIAMVEPKDKAELHLLTLFKILHCASFVTSSAAKHLILRRVVAAPPFSSSSSSSSSTSSSSSSSSAPSHSALSGRLPRHRESACVCYVLRWVATPCKTFAELYATFEAAGAIKLMQEVGGSDDCSLPCHEPPKWRSRDAKDIEILIGAQGTG
eukprot:GHVT01049367.1.p1 GENE.GHVT01049367.1~~GHVT01049367.1.p1  ORF type:complete len:330 (+),score=90.19 GHVT01049367.1:2426-3415(+)